MPKGNKEKPDGRHLHGLATGAKTWIDPRSVFLERGFSGTSIAEAARRAGASQPTVGYAFDATEDFFGVAPVEADAGGNPVRLAQQQRMRNPPVEPDRVSQFSKTDDGAAMILCRAAGGGG